MSTSVALVNTNRMRPAIGPIGLEYMAEALHAAGHVVDVLDLCWEEHVVEAIEGFFGTRDFELVGVTLRNTDDCSISSRRTFIPECCRTLDAIRHCTDAPIVMGGVGFSVMPEIVLERCGADAGIWGEGEVAMVEVAEAIDRGLDWHEGPNLVISDGGEWCRTKARAIELSELPMMTRRWFDNVRYFERGGQAGFETKRGCPGRCIYCADPVAKGTRVRCRPPAAIADEIEALLGQGIDHLHTCDSEFNRPAEHAKAVCEEIVSRGLGDRFRWYAYCTPTCFSSDLARGMRDAGCVGINFGTDSGDATMLERLGRRFAPDDIVSAVRTCHDAGIKVMLDLLAGAPGETEETLRRTVEVMRRAGPDRVGITVGVRLYPGTALTVSRSRGELEGGLIGDDDAADPPFFVEPAVASFIMDLLDELIGEDSRFLFFNTSKPGKGYNYSANDHLVEMIRSGRRGAYWDML